MKKIAIVSLLCAGLAGCVTASEVEGKIKQVQDYTRLACAFLPTVETVAKILAGGTIVDTAASVGQSICAAVTTVPLADGPGKNVPMVRGIVIKGKFIK